MYSLEGNGLQIEYAPETAQLTVCLEKEKWVWTGEPSVRLKDSTEILFSLAHCESARYDTGVSVGVRASYRFPDSAGGFTVHTSADIMFDGSLSFSSYIENEPECGIGAVCWPPAFAFDADEGAGYTVLPRMQGVLLPARYEKTINGGRYEGTIFERDAYMPIFGQVRNGSGYVAIFDTPFDAVYLFEHKPCGDTTIAPVFIASLGRMAYPRRILYRFRNSCDYNTMAKDYREYLKQRGRLVTLREKAVRNPAVMKLVGTPVVHTGIAVHISEKSDYYTPGEPEKNDIVTTFEKRAEQLRELKKKGVERAYLHLDGWGRNGYDNMHPDVFPPSELAGGANGMRELSDVCRELGYTFGIHDQYRDYYLDADSFSYDNAVLDEDGGHPMCSIWYGGEQTILCPELAPSYVRRNYDTFDNLGIKIEGAYLDVFSVVHADECFSPAHPVTREYCMAKRRECFELLNSRGVITSSEETIDCIVPSIFLCHHSPFFTVDLGRRSEIIGIPIPLFNLVWHDCIVIPWSAFGANGNWGLPEGYDGLLLAFLNGGTIYCDIEEKEENIRTIKKLLEVQKKIAMCEMTEHSFADGNYKKQKTVFADNTEIIVDFDKNTVTVNGERVI